MDDSLPDPDLKIILLGDSAVGKSKLIERYLMDEYNPRQLSTYALTLFRKEVKLESGESSVVDFWDTAGQEAFNRMHPSYYYRAHCCILLFDVTRKVTYQHLADWYKELREYCENIPVVLVANKIDVDYNVRKAFGLSYFLNLTGSTLPKNLFTCRLLEKSSSSLQSTTSLSFSFLQLTEPMLSRYLNRQFSKLNGSRSLAVTYLATCLIC
jgi:small GTP-binding protein